MAGEDEAKENLTEIVNYLHDPTKYQEIGASMPKGVLLPVPTVCSIRFGAPLEHSPEDLKEDFLERARNAIISLAQP